MPPLMQSQTMTAADTINFLIQRHNYLHRKCQFDSFMPTYCREISTKNNHRVQKKHGHYRG